MSDLWPETPWVVSSYLREVLDGPRVVTRTPNQLESVLGSVGGLVRVRRGPGSDDFITDSATVDVETFTLASDEAGAWPLAERTRQALHALAGRMHEGVLIDAVRTTAAPVEVDYENAAVIRYVAAYTLEARRARG